MQPKRENGRRAEERSERFDATDAPVRERSRASEFEGRFHVARLEWVAHREDDDDELLGYCSEPMS